MAPLVGASGGLGLGGPAAARRATGTDADVGSSLKGADLTNAVANNEPGRAQARLELSSHHGAAPAGRVDNDGRIWTNLILLRIR